MSRVQYDSTSLAVAASNTIPSYRRVVFTAGLVALATAGQIGIGSSSVNHEAATAGQVIGVDLFNAGGEFEIECDSSTPVIGSIMYAAADGKVSTTANGCRVGIALTKKTYRGESVSTVRVLVDRPGLGLVYNSPSNSTAIASATGPANFDRSFTIPAGGLKDGDRVDIYYNGVASRTGTPTLALRLLIGSTAVQSTAAIDPTATGLFSGSFNGQIRDESGTLKIVGVGRGFIGAAGTTLKGSTLAPTTIDMSTSKLVAVEATWSAADALNTATLQNLDIRVRSA